DLPTPGSPASSTAAPATRPPPSTRSNSATCVGRRSASVDGISPIGRAGAVTAVALVDGPATAFASTTVPQAWHSPQRPTHLAVVQPHSVQRYPGDDFFAAGMRPRYRRHLTGPRLSVPHERAPGPTLDHMV